MTIAKLRAVLGVFEAGKVVANPKAWKRGQITTTAIVSLLWAGVSTANAFGNPLPVDKDLIDLLAVGILGVGNWIVTVVSTDKIGIRKKGH